MPGSKSKTWGRLCNDFDSSIMVGILLVPLLHFMAELLQGCTWTGWVIICILWSRRYFWTMTQFCRTTVPPHSHSWNCSLMVWRAWRWTSASSLASTIARIEHHWTTLVSFGD
jgi:hypothetical protein